MAVVIGIAAIYGLSDYYLNSVGHELMLNWIRSESAAIQEGNLLSSATKGQRFLLSSDYIQAIKLIKIDKDQINERLHFGDVFTLTKNDIPEMNQEIKIKRVGFLHSQAFYKIQDRDEMYIIFDVESKFLNFVFFAVIALMILMLIALISTIRSVEKKEYIKREVIFKQALNDFISEEQPSTVIKAELPNLMSWWQDKKDQVRLAQQVAIHNQSKILLGEIASRVGHDIVGSVRNIEILARRMTGLNQEQQGHFGDSIHKIKTIVADISKQTKESISDENLTSVQPQKINISELLSNVVLQKQIEFGNQIQFSKPDLIFVEDEKLNTLEFERSISNLINNAIEASINKSKVIVDLYSDNNFIKIDIKDSGHGICDSDLHKIGAKGFTSGKENGTGIGVYYAKQFVENLGGRLDIQSAVGVGTDVSVLIPQL